MDIQFKLKPNSKRRIEQFCPTTTLPFGVERTDHMVLMQYSPERGWHNAQIVPYGPLSIMPGATCLNYGQQFFEGAKAYKIGEELYTFRLDQNARRFNNSARLLRAPQIPVEQQIELIHTLLDIERLWFPEGQPGSSLYIRPLMLGVDDEVRVKSSQTHTYCVFLSPSGAYYPGGFNTAVSILITQLLHRSAPGMLGPAKAGANYACSIKPGDLAARFGAKQVLYTTDGLVDEAGAMNHYHVLKDGTVVIPTQRDPILNAITSRSIEELSSMMGIEVRRKTVYLEDMIQGIKRGEIVEAGGFGTAAVVSPIGKYLCLKDQEMSPALLDEILDGRVPEEKLRQYVEEIVVGDGQVGPISRRMYEYYTEMLAGEKIAPSGWLVKVPREAARAA